MNRIVATILFLLVLAAAHARAQGLAVSEALQLDVATDTLLLSHDFVVSGTLGLQLDSIYFLQTPLDYTVDERFGIITLTPFFKRLLVDTSSPHLLHAVYRYRPINLQREYYTRKLVTRIDSTGEKRQIAEERGGLTATSIFGRDFQRSGSIIRGFTVGSNRDLSLQSGVRLQFSGKITDDVEVLGALTDEQTPIQPEGNTQTLREVDNIFIELRSPYVGGTVGKFTAENHSSEYTAFARKLEGLKVIGRYGTYGSTEVVAAVSPGKFRTQQIQGVERNQGPYRLTGPSGERTIIVIAGTEKVFVDGVLMVRGESNDYIIDYGTGEIFFQTRRPITSASRITVDFEYTDRQYSRSFVSVANTGALFDGALTLTANYIREADNPDATIDLTLHDDDKALLAAAGGDPNKAVRSGVFEVAPDDTTQIPFYYLDTVVNNGQVDTVYRYAPGDPRARYNVIFSVARNGGGDYENVAFGQYRYVGKGLGRYLPVIYLPLPELRQIGALRLSARPSKYVELSGEVAYSDASLNRFSIDPAAQRQGLAFNTAVLARSDSLRLGGINMGTVSLNANASILDAGFSTIERLGDVEFNNKWNTSSLLGQSGFNERKAEGILTYAPIPRLQLSAAPGYLRRGDFFESLRQQYSARLLGDTAWPAADYTFELIATSDSLLGGREGIWQKQRGGVSYQLGPVNPGMRFEYERREDRGTALTDTIYPGSFRFFEFGPDVQVQFPFLEATARARFRVDDSVRFDPGTQQNMYLRDGASQTYTLNGTIVGVRDLSSSLEFTYRNKTYDSVPSVNPALRLDNNTILVRSKTRWSGFDRAADFDALYEVQTEQAARLQRLFIRVPYGTGQYVWYDLDSNGIQTEDEFRLTNAGDGQYNRLDLPTEQLFPIIDLRTSLRVRLEPARFLTPGTPLGDLLAPVTTETYLRVEEKSQTTNESDIYLLRLSHFQDDSTTIAGNSIIQQDINLFERNQEYSFRLRYQDRQGLTRLVSTIERSSDIERSLRSRWQPTLDIGLQLDLAANSSLLRSTDTLSLRTYDLTTLSSISDFSYRPEQSLELGWKFRITQSEDVLPVIPRTAFISSNELRAIYSIETYGRIRATLERTTVTGENIGENALALPYQLTDGYGIGVTWVGNIGADYRIGANVQLSVNYNGRAQPPTDRVVHTGTAEVRVLF